MTQVQSTSRSGSISLRQMFPSVTAGTTSLVDHLTSESRSERSIKAPHYLTAHYWWAYVHPKAIWFFERQWLVNLILWGNYARLRNAAITELGEVLPGATLQVACAYGDLTGKLVQRVAAGGGRLDVIDVLPMQLENLRHKLPVRRASTVADHGFRRSQASGRQLRSGAVVFPFARTARRLSRANAGRSLPGGQARRQDCHGRLCAAALVASASLFVAALARRPRAFRAGFMASRDRPLAARQPRRPGGASSPSSAGSIRKSSSHAEPRIGFSADAAIGSLCKRNMSSGRGKLVG